MKVRAKVTHTQPGTQFYREEGQEFEHQGKLYKHVELASKPAAKPAETEAPTGEAAGETEDKN